VEGVSGAHGSRHGVPQRAQSVQLTTSRTRTTILADLSADFCPTRALFLARMSIGDARVYTCTCTVDDKLSCTRLKNYTIGASLMTVSVSVSVSVPWGSSLNTQHSERIELEHFYRPRSRGDNTFDSVRVCVRPFVCGRSPL